MYSTCTNTQPHLLLPLRPVWMSAQHKKCVQHGNIRLWRGSLSGSTDALHHQPERINTLDITCTFDLFYNFPTFSSNTYNDNFYLQWPLLVGNLYIVIFGHFDLLVIFHITQRLSLRMKLQNRLKRPPTTIN